MRMEGSCLLFSRCFHTIIYAVKHRGFTDPGFQDNHGPFNGIIMPLSPAVRDMIDRWGVSYLLRGTGIPPHLVQAAVKRENAIDWESLRVNAYTGGAISSLRVRDRRD